MLLLQPSQSLGAVVINESKPRLLGYAFNGNAFIVPRSFFCRTTRTFWKRSTGSNCSRKRIQARRLRSRDSREKGEETSQREGGKERKAGFSFFSSDVVANHRRRLDVGLIFFSGRKDNGLRKQIRNVRVCTVSFEKSLFGTLRKEGDSSIEVSCFSKLDKRKNLRNGTRRNGREGEGQRKRKRKKEGSYWWRHRFLPSIYLFHSHFFASKVGKGWSMGGFLDQKERETGSGWKGRESLNPLNARNNLRSVSSAFTTTIFFVGFFQLRLRSLKPPLLSVPLYLCRENCHQSEITFLLSVQQFSSL